MTDNVNVGKSKLARWLAFLRAPVDGSSLAVFRIWFAVCMLINTWVYTIDVHIDYLKPKMFFSFIPGMIMWPGIGIYVHFAIMAVAAAMVGLGLYYRTAAIVLFITHTYLFLLEKAYYQNHFYLVSLLSFLLIILPADRVWSADQGDKGTVPRWSVLILKLQIAIVYFFGGVAKLNSDWLAGQPQTEYLIQFSHEPIIGPIVSHPWFATLVTYAGITIDLLIGAALFYKPTFWFGAVIALLFHLANSRLFPIGIFPWLMIGTIGLFAPYDWPRQILKRLKALSKDTGVKESAHLESAQEKMEQPKTESTTKVNAQLGIIVFLHVFIFLQLILPLRRFLYPGDTSWTEQGHRFSWSMMLRTKLVKSFEVTVKDPRTGKSYVSNLMNTDLSPKQVFHMQTRPDMILQFAHYVADVEQKRLGVRPIVTVRAVESLNLRQPQDLIDPNVNLAEQQDTILNAPWIVPLYKAINLSKQKQVITGGH